MSWSSRSLLIGILGLVAAAVLAEAWTGFASGGRYRGHGPRAVLLFDEPPPPLFSSGPADGPSEQDREREIAVRMAVLTSDQVLGSALARAGNANLSIVKRQADPMGWLRDHLVLEHEAGTPLVEISLPHGTAEEQAQLLQSIVESLRQRSLDVDYSQNATSQSDLKQYLRKLNDQIEHTQRKIMELASRGAGDAGLARSRYDIEARLTLAGLERAEEQAGLTAPKQRALPAGTPNAEGQALGVRLAALDAREKVLHSRLEGIREEINELEANAARRAFLERDLESLRSRREEIEERLENLEFARDRARATFSVLEMPSAGGRG